MSFAPRNSWFTPKKNSEPAHSGSGPGHNFYNPEHIETSSQHQQPVWNNLQQEAYWHGTANPPPRSELGDGHGHRVEGDNAWNWGSTSYQPHYQPPYNNSDHYFYGNANSQTTNSDPWNWGVDDSSSNDGVTNNNVDAVDPTWNWSVENSTNYQQQAGVYTESSTPYQQHAGTYTESSSMKHHPSTYTESSIVNQDQPAAFIGSSTPYQPHIGTYIDRSMTKQHEPHTYTEISTSYHQQPSTYTVSASREILPSTDQLEEAFAVTSKTSHDRESVNKGLQIEQKDSSQLFNNLSEGKKITNSTSTGHTVNKNQFEHNFIKSEENSHEMTYLQASAPTTSPQAVNALVSNEECNNEKFSESDIGNICSEAMSNVNSHLSDLRVASELTNKDNESDMTLHTEQLIHSELSVSSVMQHTRQLLVAGGVVISDHQDIDFSVTSKHGSSGLTPQWSTESLPSQGSDDVVHALEGNRNDFMPSPLSPVSQSPCLPDVHSYEQNQCDNFNTFIVSQVANNGHPVDNFSADKLASSVDGNEHFVSDEASLNSSLSVENVCNELHNLHVGNSKGEELGNSEVVPPESNLFHQPPSVEPPISVNLSTSGPPKTNTTHISGNPYAASKNSLHHKSTNMYRVSPLQSTAVSETLNFPSPVMHTSHNDDPSILYPNDASTSPTYGATGLENTTIVDRTRVNVNGEQDVNLETLPDNKERPDVVEVEKPSSPMSLARLNNPSVQDCNTGQWSPQAAYSVSPENQEIAPRCGPDRNQYLETGQLSDDEISEVSQYGLRETGSWSGLQRMIPGQLMGNEMASSQTELQNSTRQTLNEDVSTPPPGLHRMVPGQTEQEYSVSDVADDGLAHATSSDMLQRMVPGQMTDDDSVTVSAAPGEDIPPPGLRRMVPGESSSPESQVIGSSQPPQIFQPITTVPMEARVVTGVSRGEVDGTDDQLTLGVTAPTPVSPTPDQASSSKTQPTAERSETIGSDNVETYPPTATDTTTREGSSSNRRENTNERDRRHREEEPIDERESRRRGGYRDRDREESPSGGRYEKGKRSHRTEREHHSRHGEVDRRDGDRRVEERRRDRHDVESYDKKRRDRDRPDRPKSTRERGRHDESPDARRYRDDRTHDRKRYDRDGYSTYHSNQDERRRYRRNEYRETDTGSEYSDYERHDYDRRGYDRRDYDRRDKSGYRGHEDYARYRDEPRHYRDPRSHHERKKLESHEKSYRDSHDHRPDSRDPVTRQFTPPIPAFPGLHGRSITEYMNYYNNLRTYDAAAYADWYNNVYKSLAYQQPVSYSEDRGSVHSGRSSANSGRYNRERELEQTTTSVTEDHHTMSPHRLTPSKYATAHIKATLTKKGQLIKVLPHYPLDGQPGIVEIHDIQGLFASDEIKREMSSFPGPLIKGVTHKNSLINFCNSKIKSAENNTELFDRESVILLWKLLILLLRQNGTVVGTDIAELLLSDTHVQLAPARPSAGSSPALHSSRENFYQEEQPISSSKSVFNTKSEEEMTNTFREYLLYGNTKEALEWAMKVGLWGHALFLASKMDQRTYASVMTRFANGLTINDPLQTLYQLMSGRQPAAVTCCADEKWGDWKPHLAMILSNSSSQRVDLNYKSITTLGDTLGARGCLHAAHFTYLMAQVSFGTYAQKGSKLVLLGSSHHKSFEEFASNEAIQMTEIYEYANRLADPEFTIIPLQLYKLLYAKRLSEQGLVTEAMQYAEELSNALLRQPEQYDSNFIKDVYELGDMLKYSDPFYNCAGEDVMAEDLPWLVKLKQLIVDLSYGNTYQTYADYGSTTNVSYTEGESLHHGPGSASVDHLPQVPETVSYDYNWQQSQQQLQQQQQQQSQQQQQQQQQPQYMQPYLDPTQELWVDHNQQQEQQLQSQGTDQPVVEATEAHVQSADNNQNQPTEWPNTPQSVSQWETQGHSTMIGDSGVTQEQPYSTYWDQPSQHEELSPPKISLPNSVPETFEKTQESTTHVKSSAKAPKKTEEPKPNTGSGWFGGLWNKLALRPKNQMKLPDDKNPTIVWDSERKRWTNLEADSDDPSNDLPPPPKAASLSNIPKPVITQSHVALQNHVSEHQPSTVPTSASTAPNMYKMNRSRSSRANYVDILGGSKSSSQSLPPPAEIFPSFGTQAPSSMNFFIPGASDLPETSVTDYASPNAATADDVAPAQTDSSMQGTESSQGYGGPLMFNPTDYSQPAHTNTTKMSSHYKNRYPQH